jgi:hypothetical protein
MLCRKGRFGAAKERRVSLADSEVSFSSCACVVFDVVRRVRRRRVVSAGVLCGGGGKKEKRVRGVKRTCGRMFARNLIGQLLLVRIRFPPGLFLVVRTRDEIDRRRDETRRRQEKKGRARR